VTVSSTEVIRRFKVRGKLSSRYITLYEIFKKLNSIAYQLDLPIDLENVHNVFHFLQLIKYVLDPNHAIITEPIELTDDLAYE